MKIKYEDGFEIEVYENKARDFDFLDLLASIATTENKIESIAIFSRLAKTLFGKDGFEKLKNHIRENDPDGVCTTEKLNEAVYFAIDQISEESEDSKKSSSSED